MESATSRIASVSVNTRKCIHTPNSLATRRAPKTPLGVISRRISSRARRMITSHLKTLNPPAVDTAAAPMIAVTNTTSSGGASPIMNPFVVTSDAALKN